MYLLPIFSRMKGRIFLQTSSNITSSVHHWTGQSPWKLKIRIVNIPRTRKVDWYNFNQIYFWISRCESTIILSHNFHCSKDWLLKIRSAIYFIFCFCLNIHWKYFCFLLLQLLRLKPQFSTFCFPAPSFQFDSQTTSDFHFRVRSSHVTSNFWFPLPPPNLFDWITFCFHPLLPITFHARP